MRFTTATNAKHQSLRWFKRTSIGCEINDLIRKESRKGHVSCFYMINLDQSYQLDADIVKYFMEQMGYSVYVNASYRKEKVKVKRTILNPFKSETVKHVFEGYEIYISWSQPRN